jgi:transposase
MACGAQGDAAHLTDIDKQRLGQVITRSPRLDRLHRHVTAFAKMLIQRTGIRDLDRWLATVDADDLPHLHSFANGLRRDHAAVPNGLSLPTHPEWSRAGTARSST